MFESSRVRDGRLLKRFLSGDAAAFDELYRVHSSTVYRFALYMTQDPEQASEVTQDAFVWLVSNPERYDAERGELSGFLLGVARRIALRKFGEARRWMELDRDARAAERDGEEDSDVARLKAAVGTLPEGYRAAVVLCEFEERTYDQAAQILGCSAGTVKSRLHRAKALLARKLLAGSGAGGKTMRTKAVERTCPA